jgi:type IV pilus modification protein PilV
MGIFMTSLERIRSRHASSQAGFGMIEVMVAILIITVGLLAVAYTAFGAFNDQAFARQRQSATGLANQTMEQIRALPFDTLSRGLGNTDLATMSDPKITRTGSGSTLTY